MNKNVNRHPIHIVIRRLHWNTSINFCGDHNRRPETQASIIVDHLSIEEMHLTTEFGRTRKTSPKQRSKNSHTTSNFLI